MKKILFLGILLFGNFIFLLGQDVKSIWEQSQRLNQEEKYEEAVVLLQSLKHQINKKHHDYVQVISFLGTNFIAMGDFSNAEACFMEVLKLQKKNVGKEHIEYAISLYFLGVIYTYTGNFNKAEKYYFEAITIEENVLGEKPPDYATFLKNLGTYYADIHDFESAEKFYLQIS